VSPSPFPKELRKRTGNPDFMANVEKVILRSKTVRDRLKAFGKAAREWRATI
jgi:hypothetical protein